MTLTGEDGGLEEAIEAACTDSSTDCTDSANSSFDFRIDATSAVIRQLASSISRQWADKAFNSSI